MPAGLIGLIVVLDQWTKALALHALEPGVSRPLLPPVLYLTLIRNTGAAFGLFRGQALLFIAISVAAVAILVRELCRARHNPERAKQVEGRRQLLEIGMALMLGGAVGNLIDRLRFHAVIDFLDLRVWPVFNVADSAITIGAALLVIELLRQKRNK